MRNFWSIDTRSPCDHEHVEWEPTLDVLIVRASYKLQYISEEDAADSLVREGASERDAFFAVKAGTQLLKARMVKTE